MTGSVLARYQTPSFRDAEFHFVFDEEHIDGPNNCHRVPASAMVEHTGARLWDLGKCGSAPARDRLSKFLKPGTETVGEVYWSARPASEASVWSSPVRLNAEHTSARP